MLAKAGLTAEQVGDMHHYEVDLWVKKLLKNLGVKVAQPQQALRLKDLTPEQIKAIKQPRKTTN